MKIVDSSTDDKYATFRRSDQILVTEGYVTFKTDTEIPDAVVIRRQDLFASPALATYAASIAIAIHVAEFNKNEELVAQLRAVADYFQRQSELAADEGWKLPTI